jgi:hypothetical protein
MPRIPRARPLTCVLLTGIWSCASHVPATAPALATPPSDTSRALGEVQVSKKFGYRWTLKGDWYFVPAETVQGNRLGPWYELMVAKRQGSDPILAATLATDRLSPGVGQDPQDNDERERDCTERGESEFREAGIELLATSRQRMLGVDVVELDGVRGGSHVSFRIYDRGSLRFEFRCVGGAQSPPWPCDAAFAHLDFGTPPVRVKPAQMSTDNWELLQTDDKDGIAQDMFVLTRDRYTYLIVVTAPKRDPALLEKARKGFRFIAE